MFYLYLWSSRLCYAFLGLVSLTVTALSATFSTPDNVQELHHYLDQLDWLNEGNISASTAATSVVLGQANCTAACMLLSGFFQDFVFLPTSPQYQEQQSSYWSNQQAGTRPTCFVLPKSAKHVAIAYHITATFQCNFATKGGGHSAFAGGSSVQGGITIDLQKLNTITLNAEQSITQVGAGNRWRNVYEYLTPKNLSVIGGRDSSLGVSGFTLGGGISFFSARHGLACDNVVGYELVLANGQIANANVNVNPDLYWALRGGGNNFGIVTRLDLETFPQGQILGGVNTYPITANASIFKAYQRFVADQPNDPDAALIVAFIYLQGQWSVSNDYEYAKPIRNPPIFEEFFALPTVSSTERVTDLTDITAELASYSPSGFRETYITATFKNDGEFQRNILDIFLEEIDPIKDLAGALPALVMQPISQNTIDHSRKNGGNALGLADAEGPLMLVNLAIMWSDAADDGKVYNATQRAITRSVTAAKKLGVDNRFVYQNYAAQGQDVFAGYGEANRQRLIEISEKYDPKGIFQKLQPGYFKLGRF